MYPLKAVLVGCDSTLLPTLRRELAASQVRIEAEFQDALGVSRSLGGPGRERWLFILHLNGVGDLKQFTDLAQLFPDDPVIAILNPLNDPKFVITLMRQGAAQVVMLPLQSEDFKTALECVAQRSNLTVEKRPVIAVASVHGGCGASTIALNLAAEIASVHKVPCILMELALRMGILAAYLDVEPRWTTRDLLHDVKLIDLHSVEQALVPVAENFRLLSGPYHSIAPLLVPPADLLLLIDTVRTIATGVVILDVPCTFDELYFDTLGLATSVVLVGEQKVPSIRALKVLSETLDQNAGVRQPMIVINQYDSKVPGFGVEALEKLLGVPKIYTVARDPAVGESINDGCTLRTKAPTSPALADFARLARVLLGLEEKVPERQRGSEFFHRLGRAFGMSPKK